MTDMDEYYEYGLSNDFFYDPVHVFHSFIPVRHYHYYSEYPLQDKADNKSHLCGSPSFCSDTALLDCANTTLAECNSCSLNGAIIFGFSIAVIGLAIITSNTCVLWYCLCNENFGPYSKIKASLAAADILTSIQPLGIALYNLIWSLQSTAAELNEIQFSLQNSIQATIFGTLYMFGFSSSLNHLVFLGQQRLFAIHRPLKYKMQDMRTVHAGIGCVCFFSALSAVAPKFFPKLFAFSYSHTIFLFNLTLADARTSDYSALVLMLTVIFVIPFIVMTLLLLASAILIRRKISKSRKLFGAMSKKADMEQKRKDVSVIKTLGIMQFGFTVTLLPIVIVVSLTLANVLTCKTTSIAYTVSFYFSVLNSLVNVLVYSLRDKEFRDFLRGRKNSKRRSSTLATSSTETGIWPRRSIVSIMS